MSCKQFITIEIAYIMLHLYKQCIGHAGSHYNIITNYIHSKFCLVTKMYGMLYYVNFV